MADDLQRVGLVFKADGTVDFVKSLKEVNASIQENRSAFKLAKSQWEDSTKAADKLKDRQKYLTRQTKDYSDKVKLLERELKELSSGIGKNTEKIKNKKEQLEAVKKSVDTYRGKIEKLKKEIEDLSSEEKNNEEAINKKKEQLAKVEEQYIKYSEKTEKCEKQLERLEAKEGTNQVAIQKKQTQLNEAKAILNNYEKALEEVNEKLKYGTANLEEYAEKLEKSGEKIVKAGNKMISAGTKITKGITLPIVGAATAAIKTAADFESSMSKVSAVSGATGSELELLTSKAREMGSNTKFSASEAAEAMNYMAMAGWKTEDMLAGIEGIMNLAAASGEDLANTSNIVTDALTAFGLSAKDSGHFSDVLASASSNANTNVSEMGEAFKYVGAVAGAMGYSIEDVSVAIGLMSNSGVHASQAGTALRSVITRLAKPTKESSNAMEALGLSITNSDGTMKSFNEIMIDMRSSFSGLTEDEKAFYAAQLAGQEAMPGLLAIVNSSESDFNKLSNAINNANGTAKSMADTMQDNLEGKITTLNSQLQELAISFSEIIIPVVMDVVECIQGIVTSLNEMDESQREAIIKMALVAAATGPILIVLGKMITAIGVISEGASRFIKIAVKIPEILSTIGDGAKLLFAIMAKHPFGAAIIFVGLLITALVTLYKKCDWFREGVNKVFSAVRDGIKSAIDKIKSIMDFKWKLPEIKLPKFSITGKFSLSPPSVPKISLKWNADGAILNRPTIFGMAGGVLQGGGEAGKEAVLPIEKLKTYIREELKINNQYLADVFKEALSELKIICENNVQIGDKQIADIVAKAVIKIIDSKQKGKGIAKGVFA